MYRGADIEVSFDFDTCVHIGECLRQAPGSLLKIHLSEVRPRGDQQVRVTATAFIARGGGIPRAGLLQMEGRSSSPETGSEPELVDIAGEALLDPAIMAAFQLDWSTVVNRRIASVEGTK